MLPNNSHKSSPSLFVSCRRFTDSLLNFTRITLILFWFIYESVCVDSQSCCKIPYLCQWLFKYSFYPFFSLLLLLSIFSYYYYFINTYFKIAPLVGRIHPLYITFILYIVSTKLYQARWSGIITCYWVQKYTPTFSSLLKLIACHY